MTDNGPECDECGECDAEAFVELCRELEYTIYEHNKGEE
jgi:hypothetical protein